MHIILDIETKPQENIIHLKEIVANKTLKDPVKIETDIEEKKKGLRKTLSLDTDYADIICVGVKTENEEIIFKTLKEFSEWYKGKGGILVGYNIKAFDIPIIIKQGLKQGLELPYYGLHRMTKKFNTETCIDLMEVISYQSQWKSLDELLKIYLGTEKTPIDFETASEEEICAHCLEDLKNTYKLFELFKPLI